ncbi:hypothetical protein AB205_0205640, partial [Aquarana catesbeiana]
FSFFTLFGERVLVPHPKTPTSHFEGMWPGTVQEGRSPPLLLTCQAACSDKGLVRILGGTPHQFFFNFGVEFPLKPIPDPKSQVWILRGPLRHFFLIWRRVPLNFHIRPEVPGMDFRGTPTQFFNFGSGFPSIFLPDPKGLVMD